MSLYYDNYFKWATTDGLHLFYELDNIGLTMEEIHSALFTEWTRRGQK